MRSLLFMHKILSDSCSAGSYSYHSGSYMRCGLDEFSCSLKDGTILKDSRSVISGLDKSGRFFVKIYKKNGWVRTLKRMLQYPRAYKCLAAAIRLKEIGVQTPEVLFASRYCLVTEGLEGVQWKVPEESPAALKLLTILHNAGIKHGDFNLRNIYRMPDGSLGLIDFDGAKLYPGKIPGRVRYLELAKLISSYVKFSGAAQETVPDICKEYSEKYAELTGFDFYGPALIERVRELAKRR